MLVLAVLLVAGIVIIVIQIVGDFIAECKNRNNRTREAREKEDEETKYKKWKKRRQLVKREIALKEKQKLLD